MHRLVSGAEFRDSRGSRVVRREGKVWKSLTGGAAVRFFGPLFALAVLGSAVLACQASLRVDDPASVEVSESTGDERSGQESGSGLDRGDDASDSAAAGGSDARSSPAGEAAAAESDGSDAGEASDTPVESAAGGSGDSAGERVVEESAGAVGLDGVGSCDEARLGSGCDGVDGDVEPVLLAPGEAVAFLSDRGGGPEWFVVDAVGSRARQLTDGLTSFEWSPDRSRVTYVTVGGLVVADADGSDMRVLVEGAVSSPSWSPDGTEIAYAQQTGADAPRGDLSSIHVVAVDGSSSWQVGRGQKPRWSPDGARIMFEDPVGCCDNSGGELWATSIVDLDSGDTYTIGGGFREGHIGRVVALWSPDGTMVAYTHGGDIFLLQLNEVLSEDTAAAPRPATRIVVDGRAVSWSSDAGHLAYLRSADAFCAGFCDELWITDIDGNHQRHVANVRLGSGFEWSPDGTAIAFSSEWAGGFKFVDVASASGSEELVSMPLPGSFAPSWSPDGSRIAFASEDTGYDDMQDDADIYIATADGTRLTRLTEDPHHNVAPTWIQFSVP